MPSRRVLLALACASALACGSDPPAHKTAQVGTSPTLLNQVLDACTAYAERLCESAEACCTQTGEFSQAECVDSFVETVCTPSAQLVAAGLATYDATAEEACLEVHQRAHDTCFPTWEETVQFRRELWAACHVIDGKTLEGHACETDARCALPDEADATSACVEGVCRKIALLGAREVCPYPNGDVSTCEPGLYCTTRGPGELGECIPAPAEGEPCQPEFLSAQCGLGSYCDLTAAVCRKATHTTGESCTQDTECISFSCDRPAQKCRAPISAAASLCGEQ